MENQEDNSEVIDVDSVAMSIIAYGGDARSYAAQAVSLAKKNQIEEAKEAIEEGRKSAHTAHNEQFGLISSYADGKKVENNILLSHAMGHLMCAELALELGAEMIELYSRLNRRESLETGKAADCI